MKAPIVLVELCLSVVQIITCTWLCGCSATGWRSLCSTELGKSGDFVLGRLQASSLTKTALNAVLRTISRCWANGNSQSRRLTPTGWGGMVSKARTLTQQSKLL